VRPEIPPALDEVCMKALTRELGQRFPDASAMADALEKAAQTVAAMGSVRDVASCLESVVGVDLTKQRDEVRAWLSRSEPSNPTRGPYGSIPPPPGSSKANARFIDSTKTRVEGATREPSRPQPEPVDRTALTAPDKVSSVSSAILQVSTSTSPTAPSQAAEARHRSRSKWYVAIAAAAIVAGGVGFGASRIAGKPSPATPPPAATIVAAPPPSPSPARSAESAPAEEAKEPKPVVSASAPASASAVPTKKPAVKPAVVRPNPTGAGTGTPDDLSRNPYR
jgi:serine/threonine-protein kinase